ncbi:hypothetical protein EYR40_004049 [Pleurotus pulmonarius]|nr:hypothetical protein EYR40_004049 [Pleurotus pulmonarius]KAF4606755.1 hypothetical protein EYR38_000809 [Pleurotus pulmonarius]
MANSDARIRSFQPDDLKLVQFVISKANLSKLAVANYTASTHWLALSLWVGLSSAFIQYMSWWPADTVLSYLQPFPAFACMALPIIFYIDWHNRPYFEADAEEAIRGGDLVDISEYYSRSPSSGFWLLELGERFIGLLALDASLDSQNTVAAQKSSEKPKKGTSSVATIRHFFIDEPYRPTEIQEDLLKHAIKFAFEGDDKLERIEVVGSSLSTYAENAYKKLGFRVVKEIKRTGVLRWKVELYSLDRSTWQSTL